MTTNINFTTYETTVLVDYLNSHPEYLEIIKIFINDLINDFTIDESIVILSKSIADICKDDITASVQDSSQLSRVLLFAAFETINFTEIAKYYLNKYNTRG